MFFQLNAVQFDKNAPVLYVIVAIILAAVVAQAVFFLVRAYRRGVKIGMSKAVLNKTMVRAGIFTIAPAVAILVGIVALSQKLGIPLPYCGFRSSAVSVMKPLRQIFLRGM